MYSIHEQQYILIVDYHLRMRLCGNGWILIPTIDFIDPDYI